MRYRVTLSRGADGSVVACCDDLPGCRVTAPSREDALERMRSAIAYYREMCPCDVTADAGLMIDVVEG